MGDSSNKGLPDWGPAGCEKKDGRRSDRGEVICHHVRKSGRERETGWPVDGTDDTGVQVMKELLDPEDALQNEVALASSGGVSWSA